MEIPVIGKRTDVCNKRAIMALSRGEDQLALSHWEEAMTMKGEHMDTVLNYHLYKWRIGHLSDDELLDQLKSKEVFSQGGDIGNGLLGMIKLAIGDIDEGTSIMQGIVAKAVKVI